MKVFTTFGIVFLIILTAACKFSDSFDSFKSIHSYEMVGNPNKLDSGYMDVDSNIIFSLLMDTFQLHIDIDKNKENALIFSTGKIDTVGNLNFEKQTIYFKPKNFPETYKLFDFNAKKNDSWKIDYCGILTNSILNIEKVENNGNEVIQTIRVENNSPVPPLKQTKVNRFIVSSKYGITEIEIHIGWAEKDIKIKNAL